MQNLSLEQFHHQTRAKLKRISFGKKVKFGIVTNIEDKQQIKIAHDGNRIEGWKKLP